MLVLWALPRSHGSAFEWVMRQRGDFITHHEPFALTYRYGEDRRSGRHRDEPVQAGLSFARTWTHLEAEARGKPVFIKDLAHCVTHLIDDAFLERLTHTFLIRDPKRALPSLYAHVPDFTLDEVGYAQQRALFDRLCDRDGTAPPVIDAESLAAEPVAVVRAYCAAVGLRFTPRSLRWERDPARGASWQRGAAWRHPGRRPGGRRRDYVPIDHNEHLLSAYQECLPHYLAMRAHELRYD